MKVFGIGLARTGNASLRQALDILGYSCIHFPRHILQIENCAAAVDTSVTVGFKFLDLMYPGSKFILTTRDTESWLESCEAYWAKHHKVQDAFIAQVHRTLYGTEQFDQAMFTAAMSNHIADVLTYFGRRKDLLLFRATDGWTPICEFLGKPMPDMPYPHEHIRS